VTPTTAVLTVWSRNVSDVRVIDASEIDSWAKQLSASFHFDVAPGYPEYLLGLIDVNRAIASFDGDRLVGTLRSFTTELTVPGNQVVRSAALTNVSVAPTHRRQGRLTTMIETDLRDSVDREEIVGILIASEYPIYGRFGYGPAIESATYAVRTREATFREAPIGTVELCDRSTIFEHGPTMYDRHRREQPGSIERSEDWWDRRYRRMDVPGDPPKTGQVAIYRSASGRLEGYVSYVAKLAWDGMRAQGVVTLNELVAVSPEAYNALWSYCCGIDLMTTLEAPHRTTDEVLPFLLTDSRAVKLTARNDFVWVRILNVQKALASRTYATPGRVVIDVVDPFGIAGGRFLLQGGPDGAQCETSGESADITVPIDSLGSVFLGGVSMRTLSLGNRVDENRVGAIDRFDAMFRTSRAPWCNTWF
jgi:predicted acetyltransferase